MAANRKQQVAAATALACALAAPAEGLRRVAYFDPPGILTACRGHTGDDVRSGVVYSMEQCDAWFTADMHKAIAIVESCHPGLPYPVLAAFGDAVFNTGRAIACDDATSTPSRRLRAGDLVGACNALLMYNKARVLGVLVELKGLTTRRTVEQKVCLQGVAQ